MKDSNNTSLTIRTKVASNLNNNSISSLTPLVRTTKFGNRHSTGTPLTTAAAAAAANSHNNANSDDEFELPLGNLIIDLDADIEKSNERFSGETSESHHFATAGTQPSAAASSSASNSLAIANSISNQSPAGSNPFEAATNSKAMSASKTIRDVNNGTANSNSTQQQINQSTGATQSNSSSSTGGKSVSASSTNLQTQTIDKGLKMKIKRKSSGGKSSESKHEVVQLDTNPRHNSSSNSSSNYSKSSSSSISTGSTDKNGLNNLANNGATTNSATNEVEKIKHSSSKSKNSSHKEKKEKKDKADKNSNNNSSSAAKNSNDAFGNPTPFNNSDTSRERNPVVLNFDKKALNQSSTGEHHHHPFNQLKKDTNDSVDSPPFKKSKNDNNKNTQPSSSLNYCTNTNKPEMRSVSTATNASTMTEPECLGFCEPGSAICLEGITWVEAEGVLVVNVTWRGKSYVGTLLDCTRHDWGPPHPRLCDSPTSDLESKGLKSGRGKRARSSISEQDSRLFQSKLRNGKGRRNNFTVPASPLKVDQNNKRNNRNGKDTGTDLKSNNSSQPNSRNTPTPTLLDSSDSLASSPLSKPPSSPVFIECPEPTCSKKYRHINGLKYHQTHSHSATKSDDLDDVGKEPADAEAMDVESFANSPQCKTTSDTNCNQLNSVEPNSANSSESVDSKKSKHNCDKTKNSDNDTAHSPVYSDISDAGENGNEPIESSRNAAGNSSTVGESRKVKPEKVSADLNNGDQRKESDLAKGEDVKMLVLKEEHKATSDKEDKSLKANNGVLDKNGLSVVNSQSMVTTGQPPPTMLNPAAAMNPNFQFPFNVLPPHGLPHIPPLPFPMEEDQLDAYRMRNMVEESYKHMAGFKGFGKPTDQLHLNELKQQQQPPHPQSQFKTPPLSTSISPQSQQPPTSTHSSIFNQQPSPAPNQQQSPQNKPSSPYDFAHHEKQQREEMLKLSGRGSEERFSLSSNKNQLGNLSSPKQPSSVQQMFGQQPNNAGGPSSASSNHKDEQRTPKHVKQEEGIKPTMETTGPPPAPINHSFFHSISPFQVFPGALPFDPNSPLFRAQQATVNPFNQQSFMNNLRYPNPLAPQLPPGLEMRPGLPPNLPGQEMNNKMMSANGGNKKAAFDMLQQVSQQYTDKMLSSQSPNSAIKNGLPPVSLSNPVRHSPSGQLGSLANTMRKEDNLSPQRLHHPGIPPHPVLADPYGALIKNASGFQKR